MQTPASPASAPQPDIRVEAEPVLPPVRRADVVGSLLTAIPTAFFAAVTSAALAACWLPKRPLPLAVGILVAAFPLIGTGVFVRRWWMALRALDERPAWAFLLVPFFVIAGAALGLAFMSAAARA